MKRTKTGFTIIETVLFLAVSGFLIMGVVLGTSNSISRQRFQDSTQSFVEFLRRNYYEVSSTENSRKGETGDYCTVASGKISGSIDKFPGRTNCGIYGKMLVFKNNKVLSYDVLGETREGLTQEESVNNLEMNTVKSIKDFKLDILSAFKDTDSNQCRRRYAYSYSEYRPEWQSRIETTKKPNKKGESFEATILIMRSPISGAIHTYVVKKDKDNQANIAIDTNIPNDPVPCHNLKQGLSPNSFSNIISGTNKPEDILKTETVDICLAPDKTFFGSKRRNIRIHADGHSASAVEIVSLDASRFTIDGEGNRCK